MAKALSWQVCGIISTTILAAFFMENVELASGFALLSALQGLIFYVLHERVWEMLPWGRHGAEH